MLAVGGCVVMPDEDSLRDPEEWSEMIEREGVTVWNTVPAMMHRFVPFQVVYLVKVQIMEAKKQSAIFPIQDLPKPRHC